MTTKDITGKEAPNGSRVKLADAIPLNAPLIVQIFDIYSCNLACKFCHFGLEPEKRPKLTEKPILDINLFKKIVDDMKNFPQKIKLLRFCGAGESLLDPNIVEMISYVIKSNVAEKIELITNGILLTPDVSKKLLDAKLERLKVSIYGINSKKYLEISQRKVDFDKIVENVRFFFEERNRRGANTRVYVKTMDCCLDDPIKDKEKFIELFGDYCDVYAVESVMPSVTGIDYSQWFDKTPDYNTIGIKLPEINICPQPFHLITIRPDGKIVPCQKEQMDPIGDCNTKSIVEIWNSIEMFEFQKQMLDGNQACCKICQECELVHCKPFPEDILDYDVDKLKKIYETKHSNYVRAGEQL